MSPKELIIYYKLAEKTKSNYTEEFIKSYLELDTRYHYFKTTIHNKYYKLSYQNEFLKSIYKNTGQITPIEYLDLDKFIYARLSLILLLDFSHDHNDKIIYDLDKPVYNSNNLILGNNAIYQLDIIPSDNLNKSKIKSLFDVVNNTSTNLGRRLLKDRLLYPLIDKNVIQNDYDLTERLMKDDFYTKIEKNLREICDLERIDRKMCLSMIQPYELYNYIQSYKETQNIILNLELEDDEFKKLIPSDTEFKNLENFFEETEKIFNYDELKKQNMSDANNISNIFNKKIYPEIDEQINKIQLSHTFMSSLCQKLSEYVDKKKSKETELISIKKNDREGHYLSITKTRCTLLKKKLESIHVIDIDGYELNPNKLIFKENNNNCKIIFPDLEKTSDEIERIKLLLNKLIKEKFTENIKSLYSKYKDMFKVFISFVSHIDFLKSNAKTAKLYNYTKPIIDKKTCSYFESKNLRHPIIERIIDYEYIPHDISLGKDMNGMLIFGINSSGKSSLMKSTGIAIIMAQAGLYVAAESFIYSPYNSLYTRITGNDNLFKGLSSFALEMVEVQSILNRANPNTLVIGDEICRGTEHISGNSLVASAIIMLTEAKANFIFATHLHELMKLNKIKKLDEENKIKSFHLSISYDADKDEIIYDRKLKHGSGDNIYGITVARHIVHNKSFIDMALEIKNELLNSHDSLISGKTSRYNSDLYIYQCQICGEKDKIGNIRPLETHHINFQKDCVDGFVKSKKHIKKNDKSNLVVLCDECHDKIHNDTLSIDSTVMSSSGKKIKIKEKKKSL